MNKYFLVAGIFFGSAVVSNLLFKYSPIVWIVVLLLVCGIAVWDHSRSK